MPSNKTVDATERINAMYRLMGEDSIDEFLIDLLTDIQHWCFSEAHWGDTDFESLMTMARIHLHEEI